MGVTKKYLFKITAHCRHGDALPFTLTHNIAADNLSDAIDILGTYSKSKAVSPFTVEDIIQVERTIEALVRG